MKKYAVFAKRKKNPEYLANVIWHFLNDTNDFHEAFYWSMAARDNDDYTDVQIVQSIEARVEAI